MKKDDDLKKWYAASDIFVFPSDFDTFGLVNIEALASGLPVAAFPVKGPKDIFAIKQKTQVGFLNNHLQAACLEALNALKKGELKPEDCRAFVEENYTWEKATQILKDNLVDLKIDMEARIKNSPEVHSYIEIKHPDDCLKTRLITFSDIHISTFSHDLPFPDHSNKFISQLKKINQTVKNSDSKNRHDVLALNGDIFDLSESYVWEYGKLPTTKKGKIKNSNLVIELFDKMTKNQKPFFKELRNFLKNSQNSEIVLLPGNHDHLLKICPEIREMFLSLISQDESVRSRVRFSDELKVPSLALKLEHGHRLDRFDYSKNGEVNWGDYLSLVKVNIIKNIVDRLGKLKTDNTKKNSLLNKYINRVMKVEYIRDAKLFPIYLEKIAQKAKEKQGELGKDIHDSIMKSSEDMVSYLRQTPFLTDAEALIPNTVLKNKVFRKFFMSIVNNIYKEQTHKNSIQLDEVVRNYQNDPSTVCMSMGHTHESGQDDKLVNGKQRVVSVNSGTYIPVKLGTVSKKGVVDFKRTIMPKGGVIFSARFDPSNPKQSVSIHEIGGADSEYNFYKVAA
jgi:UDP-2,3-diacylglucosamine pyrophosphatase LpxH